RPLLKVASMDEAACGTPTREGRPMATVDINTEQTAPTAPFVPLPVFSGTTYSRCADELDPERTRGLHTGLKRKLLGAARYVRGGHFRHQLVSRKPLGAKVNEWKNGLSAAMGLRKSL